MEGGKALDPSLQSFVSNGHKYTIVNSLSLARGIQFDEYVPQMKAGATIEMFYETLNEIWNCLNTLKLAEAAVKIDNLRRGIELRAYDNPAYLKICALYMCKEGEDTKAAVTIRFLLTE